MSVAKQRIINTKFWNDSYIAGLSPPEKVVILYLITNPLTNISGVYELPPRRAPFDVGIADEEMAVVFMKFEADGKLVCLTQPLGRTRERANRLRTFHWGSGEANRQPASPTAPSFVAATRLDCVSK